NNVGQIVATENGLCTFEPIVVNGFTSRNSLKLISFSGQLIQDVDPPLFSSFAVFRVSMVASPSHIALFTRNANNNTSHILLVYDHDLNLAVSKVIDGGAQYYVPGHIAANGDDLFITQVHNTNMVFDGALELPFLGTNQNFYLADFSSSAITGFSDVNIDDSNISIYPNPASDFFIISDESGSKGNTLVEITNVSGTTIQSRYFNNGENRIDLAGMTSGLYFVKLYLEENPSQPVIRKLMVK
ncbi:MAG: T9SS type A sorting domain-containing protein, partial [Bacteroidales bacterium]|nr:T9SS type A sorting domain-containing protein [Bacteroidales bacterium]